MDLDFESHQITVRQGKGRKDRVSMLPASFAQPLRDHLTLVRATYDHDLALGFGRVVMPNALAAKYPDAKVSAQVTGAIVSFLTKVLKV